MNKVPNTNTSPAKDNKLIIIEKNKKKKKNKEQNIKKGKQKNKKKKKKKKNIKHFKKYLLLKSSIYEVHHENMPI